MRVTGLAVAAVMAMAAQSADAAPLSSHSPTGIGGVDVIQVHNTCHQNIRTHGGAYPQHFHDPGTCNTVIVDDNDYDDCHHEVLRHWLPSYGKVWHRHTGSCSVQLYDAPGGPTPGVGGCIQIGPSTICGFGTP